MRGKHTLKLSAVETRHTNESHVSNTYEIE